MTGMRSHITGLPVAQRAEAVGEFDARYGEMDRVLWCLSRHCRPALIQGSASPAVESLVWTIKSWWGVQGVRSETKALMASALAEAVTWSPDLFDGQFSPGVTAEEFAFTSVSAVVHAGMRLGVPRREFSLASKVLHWLLPWRVPVYDSFVRQYLGVPASWDHPQAYRRVVRDVYAMAREMASDMSWAGTTEPLSPLHALDKCLWWLGGGNSATAAEVRQPWRVIDQLGLPRC